MMSDSEDNFDLTFDDNAQEAWREEIERRLQQIDSGAVSLIPWRDARRGLRARLEK